MYSLDGFPLQLNNMDLRESRYKENNKGTKNES